MKPQTIAVTVVVLIGIGLAAYWLFLRPPTVLSPPAIPVATDIASTPLPNATTPKPEEGNTQPGGMFAS